MKLLIGGDICPTSRDEQLFIDGNSSALWNDLIHEFKASDFVIGNLETPLIKKKTPIEKSGAHFGNNPAILNSIKKAGINFLNLANNHILDHGEEGLKTTIESLEENNFFYSGAGACAHKASEPFFLECKGKRIAVLSYTEHEFSTAGKNRPGANPLDIYDFVRRIKKIKENSDLIILLYHGGKENYMLPTPKQQKLCRFFIEQGVNTVICQHSHTGGAIEDYEGGRIFYGQGNFLFDPFPLKREWLYKGYLIQIELEETGKIKYDLIPYLHNSLYNNEIGIRKMDQKESDEFLNEIRKVSKKMETDPSYVSNSWKTLCLNLKPTYFSILNGNGRILRKLNQHFPWLSLLYTGSRKNTLHNIIRCETHNEILQTILNERS